MLGEGYVGEVRRTHGETSPLSEDLCVRHLDELDIVFRTKRLDQLEVLG